MMKFSIFVPTYNAAAWIERCIWSIRRQDYAPSAVEILVIDGGSSDGTREMAQALGAKVLDNPRKLAHFAFSEFAAHATGDLVVMFAADNEMGVENWLSMASEVFEKNIDVAALWGRQVAAPDDPPANHYYALIQNDTISFFVNRNLEYYVRVGRRIEVQGAGGWVFRVEPDRQLVWGANGLVLRLNWARCFFYREFVGDNDVFQEVIESGHDTVAYIPELSVVHHHIRSVREWASKLRRNFHGHFLTHHSERNMGWIFGRGFRLRFLLWVIYAGIPLFSGADAVMRAWRERKLCWLYHPVFNIVQLAVYSSLVLGTREGWMYLWNTARRLAASRVS